MADCAEGGRGPEEQGQKLLLVRSRPWHESVKLNGSHLTVK